MTAERRVKIFKNGRNQAVRIPREFELPGEDAVMRKEGERLVIEPAAPPSLLALLRTLKPIEEDFAPIPDPRAGGRGSLSAQFLLDTNIISDLVRDPQGRASAKIAELGEDAVATSIIVAAELRYGAAKKGSQRLAEQLETILAALEVIPLGGVCGRNLRRDAHCA